MGYGKQALQALEAFYSGQYLNLNESAPDAQSGDEEASKYFKVSKVRRLWINVSNAASLKHRL